MGATDLRDIYMRYPRSDAWGNRPSKFDAEKKGTQDVLSYARNI